METNELNKLGLNYKTVSIIGCQSSGKSTLLNLLFGTCFDVMNADRGRLQTTKGVVFSWDKARRIFVLDVEGIDSRERGDKGHIFEQSTSLLALAVSDVFVINMWTMDVGRYTASNMGLLRVVFELNLKIQEKRKYVQNVSAHT